MPGCVSNVGGGELLNFEGKRGIGTGYLPACTHR